MAKDNRALKFKGGPLKVAGKSVTEGQNCPAWELVGNDMGVVSSKQFAGKTVILSLVPSLDTPVCAVQTKRFNQEVTALSQQVVVITVSMDLPFAQKRWCAAEGVTRVVTASDYKMREFGPSFGAWLPDMGLLARAIFVVDAKNTVRHVEYVEELGSEPDYAAVMAAVKGCS